MNFTVSYPTFDAMQGDAMTSSFTSNISTKPKHDSNDEELGLNIRIILMIGHSLAFFLGTIGNGLVIYFTIFKMKRTVNVVWFLNLAIADFIVMFVLILKIVTIAKNFHWIFGSDMCRMNEAILSISLWASILLITAISIDRCISVKYPVWCQNHRTPRLATSVALAIWILAIILSVPYFIFYDVKPRGNLIACTLVINDANIERSILILYIVGFIFCFIIPLAVIISCYAIILVHIRRNHVTTSSKPLKIVAAVIIAFFVCGFPLNVFLFLELSLENGGQHYLKYAVMIGLELSLNLALLNSCINPILYAFVGRDFKEKFWRSFQSILERAFMEEPVQTSSKSKSTAESQPL